MRGRGLQAAAGGGGGGGLVAVAVVVAVVVGLCVVDTVAAVGNKLPFVYVVASGGIVGAPCGATEALACGDLDTAFSFVASEGTVGMLPGNYTGAGNRELTLTGRNVTGITLEGLVEATTDDDGTDDYSGSNSSHLAHFSGRRPVIDCGGVAVFMNVSQGELHAMDNVTVQNCGESFLLSASLGGDLDVLRATRGSAMYLRNATLIVRNCIFTNNSGAFQGGAIYASNSEISIVQSRFFNNSAEADGGAMYLYESALNANDTGFMWNSAASGGALGIECNTLQQTAALVGGYFVQNTALFAAGGILTFACHMRVVGTHFTANQAVGLDGCTLEACTGKGGAVYGTLTRAEVRDAYFDSNLAVTSADQFARGGALTFGAISEAFTSAALTNAISDVIIVNTTFINNQAIGTADAGGGGGAIYAQRAGLTLLDSFFYDNLVQSTSEFAQMSSHGGAVLLDRCTGSVRRSSFIGNQVSGGGSGGAIQVQDQSNIAVESSNFTGNAVLSSFSYDATGGALALNSDATVNISWCNFTGNLVGPLEADNADALPLSGSGGAVWVQSATTLIERSSFLSNTAITGMFSFGALGGAILFENAEMAHVRHCEFDKNAAIGSVDVFSYGDSGQGGAVASKFSSPIFEHTVFYRNIATAGGLSTSAGGALAIYYTHSGATHGTMLEECLFLENVAEGGTSEATRAGFGGGISVLESELVLDNTSFVSNFARAARQIRISSSAGAILLDVGSSIFAYRSRFIKNAAIHGYGDDFSTVVGNFANSTFWFENCTFDPIQPGDIANILINGAELDMEMHPLVQSYGRSRNSKWETSGGRAHGRSVPRVGVAESFLTKVARVHASPAAASAGSDASVWSAWNGHEINAYTSAGIEAAAFDSDMEMQMEREAEVEQFRQLETSSNLLLGTGRATAIITGGQSGFKNTLFQDRSQLMIGSFFSILTSLSTPAIGQSLCTFLSSLRGTPPSLYGISTNFTFAADPDVEKMRLYSLSLVNSSFNTDVNLDILGSGSRIMGTSMYGSAEDLEVVEPSMPDVLRERRRLNERTTTMEEVAKQQQHQQGVQHEEDNGEGGDASDMGDMEDAEANPDDAAAALEWKRSNARSLEEYRLFRMHQGNPGQIGLPASALSNPNITFQGDVALGWQSSFVTLASTLSLLAPDPQEFLRVSACQVRFNSSATFQSLLSGNRTARIIDTSNAFPSTFEITLLSEAFFVIESEGTLRVSNATVITSDAWDDIALVNDGVYVVDNELSQLVVFGAMFQTANGRIDMVIADEKDWCGPYIILSGDGPDLGNLNISVPLGVTFSAKAQWPLFSTNSTDLSALRSIAGLCGSHVCNPSFDDTGEQPGIQISNPTGVGFMINEATVELVCENASLKSSTLGSKSDDDEVTKILTGRTYLVDVSYVDCAGQNLYFSSAGRDATCDECLSNSSCKFCDNAGGGATDACVSASHSAVSCSETYKKNCCPQECSNNGRCSNDPPFDCHCNIMYTGTTCASLSIFGVLVIAIAAFIVVGGLLSYVYYQHSRKQRKEAVQGTLDDLRRELLGGNRQGSQQSVDRNGLLTPNYLESLQQELILRDVFVDFSEIQLEKDPIGEGAFGVVYKAMFRGAQVAVKMIRTEMFMALSADDLEAFRKEAYLMSRLRHPNIVLIMGISIHTQRVRLPAALVEDMDDSMGYFDDDDEDTIPGAPPPTAAQSFSSVGSRGTGGGQHGKVGVLVDGMDDGGDEHKQDEEEGRGEREPSASDALVPKNGASSDAGGGGADPDADPDAGFVYRKKQTICIVTEYLEQGSLSDLLHNNIVDPKVWTYEMILSIALQAARGMMYLHSQKPPICHRDLKSSNLLVDDHWVVKVTDFGMSRIISDEHGAPRESMISGSQDFMAPEAVAAAAAAARGSITGRSSLGRESEAGGRERKSSFNLFMTSNIGTVSWAAPEVFSDDSHINYSLKVDTYSFGIVLWELWERKMPFAQYSSRFDIMDAVLQGHRPAISMSCPPFLSTLIQKCWHQSPHQRPKFDQIVRYLREELQKVRKLRSNAAGGSNGGAGSSAGTSASHSAAMAAVAAAEAAAAAEAPDVLNTPDVSKRKFVPADVPDTETHRASFFSRFHQRRFGRNRAGAGGNTKSPSSKSSGSPSSAPAGGRMSEGRATMAGYPGPLPPVEQLGYHAPTEPVQQANWFAAPNSQVVPVHSRDSSTVTGESVSPPSATHGHMAAAAPPKQRLRSSSLGDSPQWPSGRDAPSSAGPVASATDNSAPAAEAAGDNPPPRPSAAPDSEAADTATRNPLLNAADQTTEL